MPETKPHLYEPISLENLLSFVKGTVGSSAYRHLYCIVEGKREDVLRDGDLSCAFYVSSVLKTFSLIDDIHTTVDATVRAVKEFGWQEIQEPREGCIIVWQKKYFTESGELHKHIGFYIGEGQAISNSSKKQFPDVAQWDFRPIEALLWYPSLSQSSSMEEPL